MSARSPNADVIASLAHRRVAERDTQDDAAPVTDPSDAPQPHGGYFTKAIQSVIETLSPAEAVDTATAGLTLLESAIEQAQDAIVICDAADDEGGDDAVRIPTRRGAAQQPRRPHEHHVAVAHRVDAVAACKNADAACRPPRP